MIISFNGDHGSGKSTVAKMVAEKLSYPRYYMGQIFRDLAEKEGLNLAEFQNLCKKNSWADKQVDDYLMELPKKEKNFVIESRTAWHFIPDSLKIYLKVSEKEGAKRILKEIEKNSLRNKEDFNLNSIENIIASEKARKDRDDERYQKYYGIKIRNEANYDFALDTTKLTVEEVFKKVMTFIESKINN
ncbi:MAG TPA: AAA family ATPase [Candidatus Moranbacteria bacterium]|nr:AAA family ATPase [Candidatus Moranbacteria bacterium]